MSELFRELPERANLGFLKKSAKERLAELRRTDEGARLADAQLAVAREYGFSSWRALAAKVGERGDGAGIETLTQEELLARFKRRIRKGDVEGVRRLLERSELLRGKVNEPVFDFGKRAIVAARENLPLVDLLCSFGAKINLKSDWWAGGWGILDDVKPELADELIARGAVVDVFAAAHLGRVETLRELLDGDPALVHAKGGDGCRPLHFASNAIVMDLLLARGAEIDARDVDHESTAAQWALPSSGTLRDHSGSLERVRWLLDRGGAWDLFMAIALGEAGLLEGMLRSDPGQAGILVGGGDYPPCPAAPGKHIYVYTLGEGKSVFDVAADFGQEGCAEVLERYAAPRVRFLAACGRGDEAGARSALALEPGIMNSLSESEHGRLSAAAWSGNLPAVELMLRLGFDPSAKGIHNASALHCAAWHGRSQIVQAILDRCPPAREKELVDAIEPGFKSTPLGWCCHGSSHGRNPAGDYAETARLLVRAGATVGANLEDATEAVRQAIGASIKGPVRD